MPQFPNVQIDRELVERYIMEMGALGAHSETGVWRTLYSPEWVAARELFSQWGRDAGLVVHEDAVGNVWAKLPGRETGKSVVSGSHIDTQCPGGRYDGTLGILTALIAIRALKEQFGEPRVSLEAVSLCEEEGSRFPAANFWGSRGITGQISSSEPYELRDFAGILMADAMREVGLDPARISDATRNDIGTFLELHIEQGPILEQAGVAVAVVDAITGVRQTSVTLTGQANHAGAFPMDLRRDPMAGFAEIASTITNAAVARGRPSVTTIGRCEVSPGGAGIIPREVHFTIDARHPDPATLASIHDEHERHIREVAQRRGLEVSIKVNLDKQPCLSAPKLIQLLDEGAKSLEMPTFHMVSGAGHDSQQMSKIADVAMIFVQSKEGRSHTPVEFSSIEHIVEGVRLLAASMHALAY